jgi:hypothetical protein
MEDSRSMNYRSCAWERKKSEEREKEGERGREKRKKEKEKNKFCREVSSPSSDGIERRDQEGKPGILKEGMRRRERDQEDETKTREDETKTRKDETKTREDETKTRPRREKTREHKRR